METNVPRRKFLVAVSSVATVGVAGCGGPADGETPTGTATATSTATSTPTEANTPTETAAGQYMNGVDPSATVSFDVPVDGAELTSTSVQWAASASGVTIEESGAVTEGAGHYHVLIDTDPVAQGEIIPGDDQHVHYGAGETDGVLELEPGEHTLVLQVGDGQHRAIGLTDTVDVTVAQEASLSAETSVDGSVVDWEVTAENYTIEPASEGVNSDSGHLHAIIDTDQVPVGDVIPSDANHVHFGDGSTSGSLDLAERLGDAYEPGDHTIRFQVGTGTHRATSVTTRRQVPTE